MVLQSKVLIAVGAHPDDIELGCGGTISAASAVGIKVIAVYLTKGERSGNSEARMSESKKALSILGVQDVFFGNFHDTEIPDSHQTIKFLEDIYDKFKPETVLTHTTNDTHQDHRQTAWASISAFRNASRFLAFETPRVTGHFNPNYFVDISDYVQFKWQALKCHETQKTKRYLAYESMVNLASFRGSQVGLRAAEAFEVIRFIEKI
ncbi:MAG: PIG-L deacetylase family protein [Candidatus Bathyarchaeia archaeon]